MEQPDIAARQTKLDDALRRFGASMVGIASAADLDAEVCRRLPTAVVIAVDLDREAVSEAVTDDSRYFKVTMAARDRLYRVYGIAIQMLRQWGYASLPVLDSPLAEGLPDMRADVPISHLAVRAGLGWLGKSGMLVTSRYGPRVRLGLVLTEAPLVPTAALPAARRGCGECAACADACPVGAIEGKTSPIRVPGVLPDEAGPTDGTVNPKLCNGWRREFLAALGRKSECALCMAVCPVGIASAPTALEAETAALSRIGVHLPHLSDGDDAVPAQTPPRALADEGVERPSWYGTQYGPDGSEHLTAEEIAFLTGDDDILTEDMADVVDGPEEPIDAGEPEVDAVATEVELDNDAPNAIAASPEDGQEAAHVPDATYAPGTTTEPEPSLGAGEYSIHPEVDDAPSDRGGAVALDEPDTSGVEAEAPDRAEQGAVPADAVAPADAPKRRNSRHRTRGRRPDAAPGTAASQAQGSAVPGGGMAAPGGSPVPVPPVAGGVPAQRPASGVADAGATGDAAKPAPRRRRPKPAGNRVAGAPSTPGATGADGAVAASGVTAQPAAQARAHAAAVSASPTLAVTGSTAQGAEVAPRKRPARPRRRPAKPKASDGGDHAAPTTE